MNRRIPPDAPRVAGMATVGPNPLIPGILGQTGMTGIARFAGMLSTADSMTDSAADTTT